MNIENHTTQLSYADTLAAQIQRGNNSSIGDLRAILMDAVTRTLLTLPKAQLVKVMEERKLDFHWYDGAKHPGVPVRDRRRSWEKDMPPVETKNDRGRTFARELPDTDAR